MPNPSLDDFASLAIALALGMLVGVQRGWSSRHQPAGQRIAGIRTFTLIGLLGGISALLGRDFGPALPVVTFIGVTVILAIGYWRSIDQQKDLSVTGLIGALLTFSFGALAATGAWTLAASGAIVTTLLLDNKAEIHALVDKLKATELDAALKLLLISVVMLSVLPNQQFGPWGALNPYEIWWMVVLIASISFIGYFAVRIVGTTRGLMFTSLFAGLSSSTALTLHYARLAQQNPALYRLLASGILTACGTMFPRMGIVCFLINPQLGQTMLLPVIFMTAVTLLPALLIGFRHEPAPDEQIELRQNPLELTAALGFGALLLAIILLTHLLHDWLGSAGIFLLAAVSGISDVDAVNLSLSRQAGSLIDLETASLAILLAAAVNSLTKGIMALTIGGSALGSRVLAPLGLAAIGGLGLQWLT